MPCHSHLILLHLTDHFLDGILLNLLIYRPDDYCSDTQVVTKLPQLTQKVNMWKLLHFIPRRYVFHHYTWVEGRLRAFVRSHDRIDGQLPIAAPPAAPPVPTP